MILLASILLFVALLACAIAIAKYSHEGGTPFKALGASFFVLLVVFKMARWSFEPEFWWPGIFLSYVPTLLIYVGAAAFAIRAICKEIPPYVARTLSYHVGKHSSLEKYVLEKLEGPAGVRYWALIVVISLAFCFGFACVEIHLHLDRMNRSVQREGRAHRAHPDAKANQLAPEGPPADPKVRYDLCGLASVKVGQRWRTEIMTSLKADITQSDGEGKITESATIKSTAKHCCECQITTVTNDSVSEFQSTIVNDEDVYTFMEAGETRETRHRSPLLGHVITTTNSGAGWQAFVSFNDLTPQQKLELASYAYWPDDIYPKGEVPVGHSWTLDPKQLKHRIGFDDVESGTWRFHFEQISGTVADPIAIIREEIEVNGYVKKLDGTKMYVAENTIRRLERNLRTRSESARSKVIEHRTEKQIGKVGAILVYRTTQRMETESLKNELSATSPKAKKYRPLLDVTPRAPRDGGLCWILDPGNGGKAFFLNTGGDVRRLPEDMIERCRDLICHYEMLTERGTRAHTALMQLEKDGYLFPPSRAGGLAPNDNGKRLIDRRWMDALNSVRGWTPLLSPEVVSLVKDKAIPTFASRTRKGESTESEYFQLVKIHDYLAGAHGYESDMGTLPRGKTPLEDRLTLEMHAGVIESLLARVEAHRARWEGKPWPTKNQVTKDGAKIK